jgi:hypothetical protein
MGLIRAIIGTIIGFVIWGLDGFPLSILIYIIPLSNPLEQVMFFILLGLVVGLIAGSSIWGAASSIAIIPLTYIVYPFLFGGSVRSLKYIYEEIGRLGGINLVIYLLIGAIIGGIISGRLGGEDDYIIIKLKR